MYTYTPIKMKIYFNNKNNGLNQNFLNRWTIVHNLVFTYLLKDAERL